MTRGNMAMRREVPEAAPGTVRRKRGEAIQITGQVLGPPIESNLIDEAAPGKPAPGTIAEARRKRATVTGPTTTESTLANDLAASLKPGALENADATKLPTDGRPRKDSPEVAEAKQNLRSLEMDNGFAEVVKSFFQIPDPKQEGEELRRFLSGSDKWSRLGYGEIADMLGDAQENAMRAVELLGQARITYERYKYDSDLIRAACREAAKLSLEHESERKPTIEDIDSRMKLTFKDEMKSLATRAAEAKETINMFDALATRIAERAKDLRQALARVQRAGDV